MLSVPSKRHLAPLLLPVAVEASWRLQRWPLLHDLLQQVCRCTEIERGREELGEREEETNKQRQTDRETKKRYKGESALVLRDVPC